MICAIKKDNIALLSMLCVTVFLFGACSINEQLRQSNPQSYEVNLKSSIPIGGVEQYVSATGRNKDSPILLILYGGPGWGIIPLVNVYNKELFEHFIVVNWDQRGTGKSYHGADKSVRMDQYFSDTIELIDYLLKTFEKKKLVLLAHSWGTIFGVRIAQQRPDLLYAYIGMSQIVNMIGAIQESYEYMINVTLKEHLSLISPRLSRMAPPYKSATGYRDALRHRDTLTQLGGTIYNKRSYLSFAKAYFFDDEYTFRDAINVLRGITRTLEMLWLEAISFSCYEEGQVFDIPIYLFNGLYDYLTPTDLAEEYFNYIVAPIKEYILFRRSSHSPIFEESRTFNSILINLIKPLTEPDHPTTQ